jgi:hypothetical protein
MMKNVDGHCDVELPSGKRQVRSVKLTDGDRRDWPNQYIDSFDSEVGPHIEQCLVQQAISASDIENTR